jgi:hypothetical protein
MRNTSRTDVTNPLWWITKSLLKSQESNRTFNPSNAHTHTHTYTHTHTHNAHNI